MNNDSAVLQIDLGNSSLKWRLMCGEHLLARGASAAAGSAAPPELPALEIRPSAALVASVAAEGNEVQLAEQIRRQWALEPWFARSEGETLGLRNSYLRPEMMGVDRWLAMLGAWYPRRERVCVVDAGSALTIDIVAANGQHEGGYILPGSALMQRALFRDTQRVRFDEAATVILEPGTSTAEAVCRGAALAQCGAVKLALSLAVTQGATPPGLVVAGGGGQKLIELLGEAAELRPDLVFEGLALATIARPHNIV
ncbi:MAG: type III pantothenate kinase [Chromatocurvus sp.]